MKITETLNGVLVPLRDLLHRLPLDQAKTIRLRDFRMHYGVPLGLGLQDFEEKTKSLDGIILDKESFTRFASAELQIIDGTIEVDLRIQDEDINLLIECIDATEWELSSESCEVLRLISNGRSPSDETSL